MTEIESRILAALERHQPCTTIGIVRHLPMDFPDAVRRHVKKLAASGLIVDQRTGVAGRWTLAGVDIEALPVKTKQGTKPAPPTDNLAPGRLTGRMTGDYVPPKSPMRQDALDHQACMSVHNGIGRPYTGQPLTLGVKAK